MEAEGGKARPAFFWGEFLEVSLRCRRRSDGVALRPRSDRLTCLVHKIFRIFQGLA